MATRGVGRVINQIPRRWSGHVDGCAKRGAAHGHPWARRATKQTPHGRSSPKRKPCGASACAVLAKISHIGWLAASMTRTRHVLRTMAAAILSNLTRMAAVHAWASSVPASAGRRRLTICVQANAASSTSMRVTACTGLAAAAYDTGTLDAASRARRKLACHPHLVNQYPAIGNTPIQEHKKYFYISFQ